MAEGLAEARVDRWLWAVRIFKTRTIATEACNKSRVSIAGVTIKPSRKIKLGDIISVRKPPVEYTYKVLDLAEKRMGAKLVPDFLKDITPQEELDILKMSRMSGFVDRARGMGRPTKKDRRELERFTDDHMENDDWHSEDKNQEPQ